MVQPLRTQPWTFDETAELPDRLGLRYEVVDGALVVGPPVTFPHARACMRLLLQVAPQLPPEWEVIAEAAIRLGTDGRRPDGCVVRRDARVPGRQVGAGPEQFAMVLEVVSPSSRKNDRFFKPREYAEAGVPVFWRLEPEPEPRLHVLSLVDGAFQEVQVLQGRARARVPFGLDVDLDALF